MCCSQRLAICISLLLMQDLLTSLLRQNEAIHETLMRLSLNADDGQQSGAQIQKEIKSDQPKKRGRKSLIKVVRKEQQDQPEFTEPDTKTQTQAMRSKQRIRSLTKGTSSERTTNKRRKINPPIRKQGGVTGRRRSLQKNKEWTETNGEIWIEIIDDVEATLPQSIKSTMESDQVTNSQHHKVQLRSNQQKVFESQTDIKKRRRRRTQNPSGERKSRMDNKSTKDVQVSKQTKEKLNKGDQLLIPCDKCSLFFNSLKKLSKHAAEKHI